MKGPFSGLKLPSADEYLGELKCYNCEHVQNVIVRKGITLAKKAITEKCEKCGCQVHAHKVL